MAYAKENNYKKTKKMILDEMERIENKLWNPELKKPKRNKNKPEDSLLRKE